MECSGLKKQTLQRKNRKTKKAKQNINKLSETSCHDESS